MYQKYHNNNNSKCVTFLTHYNDFPSYTLEKYIKRLQILDPKLISVKLEKTQ